MNWVVCGYHRGVDEPPIYREEAQYLADIYPLIAEAISRGCAVVHVKKKEKN